MIDKVVNQVQPSLPVEEAMALKVEQPAMQLAETTTDMINVEKKDTVNAPRQIHKHIPSFEIARLLDT